MKQTYKMTGYYMCLYSVCHNNYRSKTTRCYKR